MQGSLDPPGFMLVRRANSLSSELPSGRYTSATPRGDLTPL